MAWWPLFLAGCLVALSSVAMGALVVLNVTTVANGSSYTPAGYASITRLINKFGIQEGQRRVSFEVRAPAVLATTAPAEPPQPSPPGRSHLSHPRPGRPPRRSARSTA